MDFLRIVSPERREQLKHCATLVRSRWVSVQDIETVCLALGPYRNLTTLTAGLVALHPNCQVLNHAGGRIFTDHRLNFLEDYTGKKFEAFVRYAIVASQGGARGDGGGAIIHSHAFDNGSLSAAYKERFGGAVRKPTIRSLFWKESLLTSNLIRERQVDLNKLFQQNEKIRFLMPVRNPLDCAYSNRKTGHVRRLQGVGAEASLREVLRAVLGEFAWFLHQRDHNPGRFFYYYEHSFDAEAARRMADFLHVSSDPDWISGVLSAYELKGSYDHGHDLVEYYVSLVEEMFADRPDVTEQLLKFAHAPTSRRGRPHASS